MRLLFAVTDRLRTLGIGDRQVDGEADAMSDGFVWGSTNNRSIVGVLTQFSLDLRFMWTRDPHAAPEALANLLSESPMRQIGYDDPRRRTLTLFGAGLADTHTVH